MGDFLRLRCVITSGFIQNIAITLLPVLIYQVYWSKLKSPTELITTHKVLFGVVSSISVVLSMSFPFYTHSGMVFDLRLIPLAISILYGEITVGIFTVLVLVAFRSYLGGPGVYFAIIVEPLLLLLFFLLIKRYKTYGYKKRSVVGTLMMSIVLLLKCVFSFLFIPTFGSIVDGHVLIIFMLTNTVIMYCNLFLIERTRYQILLEQKINLSEKHELVSHLAASIAHEIRNPLTVISGFLQFMNESTSMDQFKRYRELMLDELGRAESIISDYLMLAKPEIGITETFSVTEVIHVAMNIGNSYALSNNVELQGSLEPDLFITVEKSKLVQVLVNITKNAVEAMPYGGSIMIASHAKRDRVRIQIIDQGIGMTSEQISRLGQPFYSTKEKGTGLGLMVCYNIIAAMNGEISVVSDIGKGSTFTISLPLANGAKEWPRSSAV